MNKNELITAIADIAKSTKIDAEKFLAAFEEVVTSALKKGDKISLIGFMSIEQAKRNAKTGRNPKTGEQIKIAAKNVVKVKAGKGLLEAIN